MAITKLPDYIGNLDAMPYETRLRLPVVCALLGVKRATIWRWTSAGRLKAHRLGRTTAWVLGDIRKLLAEAA